MGCRTTTPAFKDVPFADDPVETQSRADQYELRPGDSVIIVASDSGKPEHVRIQEDGTLAVPSLGMIFAAGKTVEELRKELVAKNPGLYGRWHQHADLIYYVRGEIEYPGPKPFAVGINISQAIQAAGGFTKLANRNKVVIVRHDGRTEIVRLNGLSPEAPELRVFPSDSITVKRRGLFVRWP